MIFDRTNRTALAASLTIGGSATLLAIASWRCFEFDRALFVYAQALILSLALTVYRFVIWTNRPPTRLLYGRAVQMAFRAEGLTNRLMHVAKRTVSYFAINRFVLRRGIDRWAAHWPIMVGCVMAMAIVVPLIFGWVWFETPADDFHSYQVMLFGQHIRTIPVDGVEAFIAFHGLVWASFPVILGTGVALVRRLRDRGDQAVQTFGNDFLPLILLLSIAVTGLLMTISYTFVTGFWHKPLAVIHCAIVCGTLIWLPFSKLFHIPQRTLKLAHMVYEHESQQQQRAVCHRCGDDFASQQQIEDLIEMQETLGYRYLIDDIKLAGKASHYQNICPRCRRATLVVTQSRLANTHQARALPIT